jgi:hypothetical protein
MMMRKKNMMKKNQGERERGKEESDDYFTSLVRWGLLFTSMYGLGINLGYMTEFRTTILLKARKIPLLLRDRTKIRGCRTN